MLNNRGQSLVMFVIILPILLLIFILVMDIGNIVVAKQKLNNINEIVLDYGLDNLDNNDISNKLQELIKLNDREIDETRVYIENDKIYVELNDKVNGIFSRFVNISIFNVKSYYVGYIENDEKRIEKVSGWLMCIILMEK